MVKRVASLLLVGLLLSGCAGGKQAVGNAAWAFLCEDGFKANRNDVLNLASKLASQALPILGGLLFDLFVEQARKAACDAHAAAGGAKGLPLPKVLVAVPNSNEKVLVRFSR